MWGTTYRCWNAGWWLYRQMCSNTHTHTQSSGLLFINRSDSQNSHGLVLAPPSTLLPSPAIDTLLIHPTGNVGKFPDVNPKFCSFGTLGSAQGEGGGRVGGMFEFAQLDKPDPGLCLPQHPPSVLLGSKRPTERGTSTSHLYTGNGTTPFSFFC